MIFKYKKVVDAFTTYCLRGPDNNLMEAGGQITELCTINGITYVSIPDTLTLPEQPAEITVEEATVTSELIEEIKAASPHVQLINSRVIDMIRERYSINDEIKMLRIGPSDETSAYNDYAEAARAWGRAEKAKLGL